jgi:hypothetical protein
VHHHDGITGTAKEHVRDDYEKKLKDGMESSKEIMESMIGSFMGKTTRPLITMNSSVLNTENVTKSFFLI